MDKAYIKSLCLGKKIMLLTLQGHYSDNLLKLLETFAVLTGGDLFIADGNHRIKKKKLSWYKATNYVYGGFVYEMVEQAEKLGYDQIIFVSDAEQQTPKMDDASRMGKNSQFLLLGTMDDKQTWRSTYLHNLKNAKIPVLEMRDSGNIRRIEPFKRTDAMIINPKLKIVCESWAHTNVFWVETREDETQPFPHAINPNLYDTLEQAVNGQIVQLKNKMKDLDEEVKEFRELKASMRKVRSFFGGDEEQMARMLFSAPFGPRFPRF